MIIATDSNGIHCVLSAHGSLSSHWLMNQYNHNCDQSRDIGIMCQDAIILCKSIHCTLIIVLGLLYDKCIDWLSVSNKVGKNAA